MTNVLIDVKADIISKAYWKNDRRFAAICNAALFCGTDIISEMNVIQRDSEETTYFETQDAIIGKERRRDLIREIQLSETNILVDIENQQTKDKTIPLRDLIYTAMNYINQMNNEKNNIKAVFMIVLFYGEENWKNNDTLSELIKVPDQLKEIFNDWKPIIIDIKNYDIELINDQEVRECFEAIQRIYKWDGNSQLFEGMTLNKETALFVSIVTGCKELEEYVKQYKEKEEINMCRSFDMVLERERKKVRTEEQSNFARVLERERKKEAERVRTEEQSNFTKVLERERKKEAERVRSEEQSNFTSVLEKERNKIKIDTLLMLTKRKLGSISQDLMDKMKQANDEQLNTLTLKIFDITNEQDIIQILS